MKLLIRIKIVIAVIAVLLIGCTKKQDANGITDDGFSTVITDLVGDTSASMSQGGAGAFKSLYFSFTTNDKIEISSGEQTTVKWDLAFTGPYNSEIYVNYGGYQYNPGYGGAGKGAVVVADKPYSLVDAAPADAVFESSGITKIGWDAGDGRGWFFYSLNNHICVPVKNRTFILRTATGKYAKLEVINIYKGNPSVVTDLFWPAPYLTFRYYVQQDGSRDLRTN
ncbi:MAG: HmuY family protein [Chitinophagaceae bacterium]